MRKLTGGFVLLLCICLLFTRDASAVITSNSPGSTGETISMDSINHYLNEFQSLSRKEKKQKIKEAKKHWKTQGKSTSESSADGDIVFLAILALLIPPLAVYLKEKKINKRFWITLLLWFLFLLPGIVFALLIVFGVI